MFPDHALRTDAIDKAIVTIVTSTIILLRFECDSTAVRLLIDRATTILR